MRSLPIFVSAAWLTELLKLRRTAALLVTVVAPYVVVLAFAIFAALEGETFLRSPHVEAWAWLMESAATAWSLVFLPLFMGLITALAAALEHRSEGFKHLFALPVPRGAIYAGKQLALFTLLAASFALLGLGLAVAGLALRALRPELGFEAPLPLGRLAALLAGQTAACGFALAVQTWVSLVRRDFALPVGLGFLATILLVALRAVDASLARFLPWSFPVEVARSFAQDAPDLRWALAGLAGGLAFAAYAGWSFSRRDVL